MASLFVSSQLSVHDMETAFAWIKDKQCTLCADMTRCKHGKTASDLKNVLSYVDWQFCNYEEGALLTGEKTPARIARVLLDCGASHVIVKLGREGCYYADAAVQASFPAVPQCAVVDTTGAGDTFAGAFMHALYRGEPVPECIRFATAAAGICISFRGCAAENLSEHAIRCFMKKLSV